MSGRPRYCRGRESNDSLFRRSGISIFPPQGSRHMLLHIMPMPLDSLRRLRLRLMDRMEGLHLELQELHQQHHSSLP
jgi:hypothetical protein